jgi:hypothetical protein
MATSAVSKLKQLLLPKSRQSEHSDENDQSHTANQEAFDAALADFQRTPPPRPLHVDMGEDFNEKNVSFEDVDDSKEMDTSSGVLGSFKAAAGAARDRRSTVISARKDSLLPRPVGSNHGDDQHRIVNSGRPLSEGIFSPDDSRKFATHTLAKHISALGAPVPQVIPAATTKNPTTKRSSVPLCHSDQTQTLSGTSTASGGILTGQEFYEHSKQFTPGARRQGPIYFRTTEPTTPSRSEWPPKIFKKALGEKSVGQVSNTMAGKQIVNGMDGKQQTEIGEPAKGHKKVLLTQNRCYSCDMLMDSRDPTASFPPRPSSPICAVDPLFRSIAPLRPAGEVLMAY